jgi:hypothetical protein
MLKDASNLWGKDTFETEKIIKDKHGKLFQVASIGLVEKILLNLLVSPMLKVFCWDEQVLVRLWVQKK